MKKEELRTGDVVQYRNGQIRKVMLNTGVEGFEDVVIDERGGSYLYLEQLKDHLDTESGESCDVVKVFRPTCKEQLFLFDIYKMELIWEIKHTRIFDAELFIKAEGFDDYLRNKCWVDHCHGKEVDDEGYCGLYIIPDKYTKEVNNGRM
jgi:hypothetical protein